MSDLISRQAAIDTEGLDAQIRCEMCRNPMHTDRGCDGNCKYDEKLYERIMQILDERIRPLPSVQPEQKKDGETMLTIEQKKHVDAFEYWVKTNTENGVSTLPESICKDIIAILRYKDGDKHETD